jgi:branched-chain amino acid transport system substrate-binding protein
MKRFTPRLAPLAATAMAVLALTAAGCSSGGSGSSTSPSATAAGSNTAGAGTSPFGTAKKATGTPYVFGMINDETGAVTFPEARQGAIAAADYVNNYLGGINGHPIQIDSCTGDGTPATAARCANQLVAAHPVAILGAADVGAPASIPIYQHANLAYLGGIPFTAAPETAANSVQFWSVSVGDNAAAAVYAGKTLGIKSVAIVYFSNPQGSALLPQITPVFKAAGVTTIKDIPLSPTSPDPSPQAALVESSGAQLVYVDIPNGCGNVLKALKAVGYAGKIMGIDPCGAPPVIQAASGGADGMYIASPFVLQSGDSAQSQLFNAAMKQWAAPGTLVDSISTAGFATVMNVQQVLSTISGPLTTASILAAFKSGTHQNFMSHDYTCDGQSLLGAPSICNDYYLMNQIRSGALTQASASDWVTSKGYFKGITG